jgi:hypothetical protein
LIQKIFSSFFKNENYKRVFMQLFSADTTIFSKNF